MKGQMDFDIDLSNPIIFNPLAILITLISMVAMIFIKDIIMRVLIGFEIVAVIGLLVYNNFIKD